MAKGAPHWAFPLCRNVPLPEVSTVLFSTGRAFAFAGIPPLVTLLKHGISPRIAYFSIDFKSAMKCRYASGIFFLSFSIRAMSSADSTYIIPFRWRHPKSCANNTSDEAVTSSSTWVLTHGLGSESASSRSYRTPGSPQYGQPMQVIPTPARSWGLPPVRSRPARPLPVGGVCWIG